MHWYLKNSLNGSISQLYTGEMEDLVKFIADEVHTEVLRDLQHMWRVMAELPCTYSPHTAAGAAYEAACKAAVYEYVRANPEFCWLFYSEGWSGPHGKQLVNQLIVVDSPDDYPSPGKGGEK